MQIRTAGMFRVCIVVVPGNRILGMVWCYGNPRNSRRWCRISTWSTFDIALSVILRKAVCWSVDSWIMCWKCLCCGSSPVLTTVFALNVGSCTFDLVGVRGHWKHYWNQCPVLLYPQHAVGWLSRCGLVHYDGKYCFRFTSTKLLSFEIVQRYIRDHIPWGGGLELAVLIDAYPYRPSEPYYCR